MMRPSHSTTALGNPKTFDGNHHAGFDVYKHVAPKYNIHGNLISSTKNLNGRTMDVDQQKLPKGWSSRPGTVITGSYMTRTKQDLQTERKIERIPHPSFDVDGDG